MSEVVERPQAMFEAVGQAVHVAFLIQAQETSGDAPLRKALIRAMESLHLEPRQRAWLDQLKGGGGSVNFSGLCDVEVRAQCAMITQAVKQLPAPEMWVLQAKYGQTDYEDVPDDELNRQQLGAALDRARKAVQLVRDRQQIARIALDAAREEVLACERRIARPEIEASARERYQAAREDVRLVGIELASAEAKERAARIALDRLSASSLTDSGRAAVDVAKPQRRFAFSAERIDAIKGLSDWFAPLFPRLKPLAVDCLLGRVFANHAKIGITARDMAKSFGGGYTTYLRATWKLKHHIQQLEQQAFARLEQTFREQGVI